MKRLVFSTICCSLLFVCNVNAQSKIESFFTGSLNFGYIENASDINSALERTFSNYNKKSISQASINFGMGLFLCDNFTLNYEIGYLSGIRTGGGQFKELYGGNVSLFFGYSFLKKLKFQLEAITGCKLSADYFLYNHKNFDNTVNSFNSNSINTFIPIGVIFWTKFKNKDFKDKAIGIRATYNFLIGRSEAYITGLNVKADVISPASNSLWFGLIFRM
jgi:hypothetical protein